MRSDFPNLGVRGAGNIFTKGTVLSREQAEAAGLFRESDRGEADRHPIYVATEDLNGCFVLVPAALKPEDREDPRRAARILPYSAVAYFRLKDTQYQALSDIIDGVSQDHGGVSRS